MNLVGTLGIEPRTITLKGCCSTNWATFPLKQRGVTIWKKNYLSTVFSFELFDPYKKEWYCSTVITYLCDDCPSFSCHWYQLSRCLSRHILLAVPVFLEALAVVSVFTLISLVLIDHRISLSLVVASLLLSKKWSLRVLLRVRHFSEQVYLQLVLLPISLISPILVVVRAHGSGQKWNQAALSQKEISHQIPIIQILFTS